MTKHKLIVSLVLSAILLCALNLNIEGRARQEKAAPFSKAELLALLHQIGTHHLSQGDIIGQVEERGIAFEVNDRVISELTAAGARTFLIESIRRLGKNGGHPESYPAASTGGTGEPKAGGTNAAGTGSTGEAGAAPVKPEDIAQLPLLEQTRRSVLESANELPNFIVEQTVSRYDRSAQQGDWQLQDTLELEITYQADKGEQFNLQRVSGKPAQQSYESLGGSTSTGEFGSALVALFLPRARAQFEELHRETYRGRPTVVYEFSVLKGNSSSTISDKGSGQHIISGYSGRVWIDTENKGVLRLELSYNDLPVGFPVSVSKNTIEYDWTMIGDQRYLLPINAEVIMGRNRDRYYTRNVIEFRNYHKFEGKMKVLDQ